MASSGGHSLHVPELSPASAICFSLNTTPGKQCVHKAVPQQQPLYCHLFTQLLLCSESTCHNNYFSFKLSKYPVSFLLTFVWILSPAKSDDNETYTVNNATVDTLAHATRPVNAMAQRTINIKDAVSSVQRNPCIMYISPG
jgi:hypothetical protein